MIEIFYIALLGLIAGYRETEILIKMGKWIEEITGWIVFWKGFQIWKIKIKIDSFHFMVGLFVLIWAIGLVKIFGAEIVFENDWLDITFIWWFFFYARNYMMHIWQPKWQYKRWWFLIPVLGGTLEDIFEDK